LNPDFRDMLSALFAEKVEFLIVGAYALAAHGCPRATGDLDIWIRRSAENAQRVWRALERFGAPRSRLSPDDFNAPDTVFQVGVAPRRVDILTAIDGVSFDEAWPNRRDVVIDGHPLAVLSRDDLIRNKQASGRPKDLADVAWLASQDATGTR